MIIEELAMCGFFKVFLSTKKVAFKYKICPVNVSVGLQQKEKLKSLLLFALRIVISNIYTLYQKSLVIENILVQRLVDIQ